MNSTPLVLIAFVVWSAVCWRWYTCSVKQYCGDNATAQMNNTQDTGIEATDTLTTTSTNTAAENSGATPGATNKSVNRDTKPISESLMNEVQMEQVEDRMVIHFPYNSIRKEDDAAIDDYLTRLATELVSSGSKVSITGHTDFVGTSKYNTQFGFLRANSIRNILVKKGVPKSQIKTRSYGESKAIATNDTPWGRYRNRRVEIRINN